jgi:hypothetical protein
MEVNSTSSERNWFAGNQFSKQNWEKGWVFISQHFLQEYITVLKSLFIFQNMKQCCSIMRRNITTNIKGAYFSLTGNWFMVITYYTCSCSFCESVLHVASLLKNILIVWLHSSSHAFTFVEWNVLMELSFNGCILLCLYISLLNPSKHNINEICIITFNGALLHVSASGSHHQAKYN